MNRAFKRIICALLAFSTLLQFGCLNRSSAKGFILDGVKHAGFEWILDNDAVFDLLTDN